jgi:hypothetical protein
VIDPSDHADPDDLPETPTAAGDIDSAARSCFVILIIVAAVALLLCVAFAISKAV